MTTEGLAPTDAMLERLAELSRKIEAYRTAIFLAEQEQLRLRADLRRSGWQPPEVQIV